MTFDPQISGFFVVYGRQCPQEVNLIRCNDVRRDEIRSTNIGFNYNFNITFTKLTYNYKGF